MTASRFDESPHLSLRVYASVFSSSNANNLHHTLQLDLAAQVELHPLACIGDDPDTIHPHEALQHADRDEFIKAMRKELQDHITCKHWAIVHIKNILSIRKLYPWYGLRKERRIYFEKS